MRNMYYGIIESRFGEQTENPMLKERKSERKNHKTKLNNKNKNFILTGGCRRCTHTRTSVCLSEQFFTGAKETR
jgi:hypothetical protein